MYYVVIQQLNNPRKLHAIKEKKKQKTSTPEHSHIRRFLIRTTIVHVIDFCGRSHPQTQGSLVVGRNLYISQSKAAYIVTVNSYQVVITKLGP